MKRLILSTKALWHQWRALKLTHRARVLLDAAEAHGAEAAINLMTSRSLARGPLPTHNGDVEPAPPSGCLFVGQTLLAAIVGLFIAGLWIWISARTGR